jgi:hypothetical protein
MREFMPSATRGTLLKYEKELSLVIGHWSLVKNQYLKTFFNRPGLPAPPWTRVASAKAFDYFFCLLWIALWFNFELVIIRRLT